MTSVEADFDRLALLDEEGWTANNHYHALLLKQIPENCENALEIGCGTGAFARQLAKRCRRVTALERRSASFPESLRRLRFRLTAWYVGTFATILLLLGVGMFAVITQRFDRDLDASLSGAAAEASEPAEDAATAGGRRRRDLRRGRARAGRSAAVRGLRARQRVPAGHRR